MTREERDAVVLCERLYSFMALASMVSISALCEAITELEEHGATTDSDADMLRAARTFLRAEIGDL